MCCRRVWQVPRASQTTWKISEVCLKLISCYFDESTTHAAIRTSSRWPAAMKAHAGGRCPSQLCTLRVYKQDHHCPSLFCLSHISACLEDTMSCFAIVSSRLHAIAGNFLVTRTTLGSLDVGGIHTMWMVYLLIWLHITSCEDLFGESLAFSLFYKQSHSPHLYHIHISSVRNRCFENISTLHNTF